MKNEEIYKWLENQKYQTEYDETGKYKMYFGVDMPKILNDFTKIELLSLLEDLSDYIPCEVYTKKVIQISNNLNRSKNEQ